MSKPIQTQVFLRDDITAILAGLTLTAQQAGDASSDYARGFSTAIAAAAIALHIAPGEVQTALEWTRVRDA